MATDDRLVRPIFRSLFTWSEKSQYNMEVQGTSVIDRSQEMVEHESYAAGFTRHNHGFARP
jgi:hypothetical protein